MKFSRRASTVYKILSETDHRCSYAFFFNIANKCSCYLLRLLRLVLEVTKSSEMSATIDQLTQCYIQKHMNRDQHLCENIISHSGDDVLFPPVYLYSR
jgi:hypothetical protein